MVRVIFVLLPAYNEGKNLKSVLDEIRLVLESRETDYRVLVINDGSKDETLRVLKSAAKEIPLEVISFEKNRGVDAVFRKGIDRICQQAGDDDIMISMDCDRTHKARTFNLLIESLNSGNDVAVASRYHEKSLSVNLPFWRAFLSDGINAMLRLIFPLKGAKDYTTFFRAYRISVLKKALELYKENFITQKGFSCMAEILIKLRVFKIRLGEVPIDLRFDLRTGGSKMNIRETIFGYLLLICRQLLRRFSGVFRKADI
ncbi:MAG: glycosyltransferase family 2 protein [Candidatus Omnitrophica bacterium]|nr:glycosyltransferase family 2 protein [Candidatus Omnitrophota bacterium]